MEEFGNKQTNRLTHSLTDWCFDSVYNIKSLINLGSLEILCWPLDCLTLSAPLKEPGARAQPRSSRDPLGLMFNLFTNIPTPLQTFGQADRQEGAGEEGAVQAGQSTCQEG